MLWTSIIVFWKYLIIFSINLLSINDIFIFSSFSALGRKCARWKADIENPEISHLNGEGRYQRRNFHTIQYMLKEKENKTKCSFAYTRCLRVAKKFLKTYHANSFFGLAWASVSNCLFKRVILIRINYSFVLSDANHHVKLKGINYNVHLITKPALVLENLSPRQCYLYSVYLVGKLFTVLLLYECSLRNIQLLNKHVCMSHLLGHIGCMSYCL